MKHATIGIVTATAVAATAAGLGASVTHAGARVAASVKGGVPSVYLSSVLYPQGTSIAHGSMATLPDVNGLKVKFYTGYLQPGQIYHENVVTGACGSRGRLIVDLGLNQADPDGSINFVTTIQQSILPSGALHVDVVQAKAGAPTVACGDIRPASVVIHLHSVKTNVVANAGGIGYITYGVPGNEVLFKTPNAIGTSVVVFAQGLEPGTLHENHIHNGQCIPDENGQVRYDLYYMETDPNGEGVEGTFFNGRINVANSYLQVHAANLQSAACANFGGDGLPMQA